VKLNFPAKQAYTQQLVPQGIKLGTKAEKKEHREAERQLYFYFYLKQGAAIV
jgi:hypothetical protein